MNVSFNFDGDAFQKSIRQQMEKKIREALSGSRFSGLKIEFNWSKEEPLKISGPDDQVAAAKKTLQDRFPK